MCGRKLLDCLLSLFECSWSGISNTWIPIKPWSILTFFYSNGHENDTQHDRAGESAFWVVVFFTPYLGHRHIKSTMKSFSIVSTHISHSSWIHFVENIHSMGFCVCVYIPAFPLMDLLRRNIMAWCVQCTVRNTSSEKHDMRTLYIRDTPKRRGTQSPC